MLDRELRTGNVLLIDVIRYSAGTDDRQSKTVEILNRMVNDTPTMINTSKEDRLCLPTGDGLAMVFFRDPRSSIYFALELDERLKAYNSQAAEGERFSLRMGSNQGLVYVIKDINQQNNLAGDGINRGHRIMDCGDAGHILISQDFADSLARADSTMAALFHPLGEFEVKHGEKITIANIHDAKHGNPEMPSRRPRVGGTLYDAAPALRIMLVISRPLIGHCRENTQGQLDLINPSPISSDVSIQSLSPPKNCMELDVLFRAIQKAEAPVEVSVLRGVTPGGLVETLVGHNTRVLHFDGHGSRHGALVFEDPHGMANLVAPELLARIVAERGIGLVYLRTSHTAQCVEALRKAGVPAVIGMADTIAQDFAIAFVSRFYSELAKGSPLKEAFERGRLMVKLLFGVDPGSENIILLSADDENVLFAQMTHQEAPPIFNSCVTKPETAPKSNMPFIGRARGMVQLTQKLANGGAVELCGENGIGKTALACAVANWHVERGRFSGGVFWVEMTDEMTMESVWDGIGVGIIGNGFRRLISEEKTSFLARYLGGKPSLIVLDDFDSVPTDNELQRWLMGIQPPSTLLIITESGASMGQVEQLQELAPSEARSLFIENARQKGWDSPIDGEDQGAIDEICHLVGYMPLAIVLMSSKASVIALRVLKKEIESSMKAVTEPDNMFLPERYRIINSCLNISYELLSSEEARRFFRRFLVMAENADDELIKATCGVAEWRSTVDELVRSSLLHKKDDRYRLHSLVRQYAEARLKADGVEDDYRQKAADAQRRHIQTREIKAELGDRDKTAISLVRISSMYQERGDLPTAVQLLTVAYDIFAAIGSANTMQTKNSLEAFRDDVGYDRFESLLNAARSNPDRVIRDVLNRGKPPGTQ